MKEELPDRDTFAMQMRAISMARMPFGRFGPRAFPPRGVPLYDLPLEYLEWFRKKGFPRSHLGELLRLLWEIKSSGSDEIFKPFRKAAGGRTDLHPPRK